MSPLFATQARCSHVTSATVGPGGDVVAVGGAVVAVGGTGVVVGWT